jgi:hypothetical protein
MFIDIQLNFYLKFFFRNMQRTINAMKDLVLESVNNFQNKDKLKY